MQVERDRVRDDRSRDRQWAACSLPAVHEAQLRRCDTRRRWREHERPCDRVIVQVRPSDFLTANDGPNFLRAARALSLHFPPIQRMADVSERIEDLSDGPDATLEERRAIRDAARGKGERRFQPGQCAIQPGLKTSGRSTHLQNR